MPRIFSYSILHYGKDYLPFALSSVSSVVDRSYIFYTPTPSHSHSSDMQNPETRNMLMGSIPVYLWSRLTWVDTENFYDEGPQRDYAVRTLIKDGADIILNLDYDEIHDSNVLEQMVREVWDRNIARNHLVNMRHFWRSFSWACNDEGWPVRFIDTRKATGTNYLSPTMFGKVNHFGYAVTDAIMKYKWSLHGHKDEMRPNWFEEHWSVWPPGDNVHPTNGRKENGEGWWKPEPYDKKLLPEVMKLHPWYNVERIE